jgi:hypothetical protein
MKKLETYGEMKLNALDVGTYTAEWDDEYGFVYTAKVVVTRKEQDPLYKDKDWLHNAYVVEKKTMQNIADIFGLTPMAILKWLRKHEIPTRDRGRRMG